MATSQMFNSWDTPHVTSIHGKQPNCA